VEVSTSRFTDPNAIITIPERCLIIRDETASLRACIDSLALEYREAIVLREIEQLSYREIAEITSAPLGTVMSRLSRARRQLKDCYLTHAAGGRQ
jgi:RNA polymerase sigma-70 factor (ECF subfamily)